MRALVLSILLAAPVFAAECPKLDGKYVCGDFRTGKVQNVEIAHTEAAGVKTFVLKIKVDGEKDAERTYVADDVVYPQQKPGYKSFTNQASCALDKDGKPELRVKVKGDPSDAEHPKQDGVAVFKLDDKGNMYDYYQGVWGTEPNKKIEETCPKK